jgi:hypothetical protein
MEGMGSVRFGVAFAVTALLCGGLAACSDGAQPPPIGDSDSSTTKDDDSGIVPCSTPAPGCSCAEAGAQFYCGVVYRRSGELLECSPGYLTCQDDGGWSGCVGPTIYDGN